MWGTHRNISKRERSSHGWNRMLKRLGCTTAERSLASLDLERNRPIEGKSSLASTGTLSGSREQTKVKRVKRGFIRKNPNALRKDQLDSNWEPQPKRRATLGDRRSQKTETWSEPFLLKRRVQRKVGPNYWKVFIWSQGVWPRRAKGLSSRINATKRRANANSRGHIRHKSKVARSEARGSQLWCQGKPACKRKRAA